MKNKKWMKGMALTLVMALTLSMAGCKKDESAATDSQSQSASGDESKDASGDTGSDNSGISADSPYKDKGFDLSKHEDVVLYAIGEQPQDMGVVLEKLNKEYLEPWINTSLEVKFISWSDVGTKYSLLLAGGEKVDLMYTSSWCNYSSESAKGAFKELSPEFLQTYLPYSYELQPVESWDQVSINGKIFAVPKNNAGFNNYNMIAARTDLLSKYGITTIDSWDSMKKAMVTLAENETQNGIYASGQRGNGEFADHIWWQTVEAEPLASGYDFMYYTHGDEDLPNWDTDVFYKFMSDDCLKLYLEMAEMAAKNVWSPNKISDTSDAKVNFESGKTATFIWNGTIADAGANLEKAGVGTYAIFDITPNTKAQRGSYADDTMTIPSSSTIPERAALVLDCIKGFPEVNNLVIGGIEGVHYNLTEDGRRTLGDSAEAYPWGAWAWGLTGKDNPMPYNEDPRGDYFGDVCKAKEYTPMASGFTFDKQNVEAELAVISSVVKEYQESFNLGMFGDETEAKYQEFVAKLKDAGVDKVMEECKAQYQEYYNKKNQK